MKTSWKFLFTGIASLAAVTSLSVTPVSAQLSKFKPVPTDTYDETKQGNTDPYERRTQSNW
jgi:hypothetical protein